MNPTNKRTPPKPALWKAAPACTNFADFAVTGGTCGGTLSGGGASCTYLLKFTPSIVGVESAPLGVSAVGDAASPHNVSLAGTGN